MSAKNRLETLKQDLRKVVLTGVGAAVLAKEGAEDLADRCLKRGQAVEPDLKKALKKLVERRKTVAKRVAGVRQQVVGRFKKLVGKARETARGAARAKHGRGDGAAAAQA